MASLSVLRSTLVLNSRAHLLLLRHKPSLSSNPLFQHSSLKTLTTTSSSSSFTISNHNLFFSPSRSFFSCFRPSKYVYPMEIGKCVKLYSSSSAITQGGEGGEGGDSTTVKRKPGRPRKIRPHDDETVSLESSTPSSLSSQNRGRGRPPGSGNKKKKEVEELESSSSLSQTQKRGRGRPPGSGNKNKEVVELESSSSLSQTQKRGRGRPPGSGKKNKEVELESSPPSLSLSQTHKRGRGRPPGSGKKKEMLKQQSMMGQEQVELWLKNWREEQKLKEQSKFVGQEQGEQQGLEREHLTSFQQAFLESAAVVASSNNMLNPWEDFLKVKNKRDLPDIDISFCYLDEDCLIIE